MLIFVSKIQSFIICSPKFYLTGGILFNYFSGLLFNYIIQHFTKKHSVWSDYVEGCIAFKEWGQSVFTIWQYNGELPQQNIN